MPDAADKHRELDDVLGALAHEARRHVLLVVWVNGGTMTAGEIAARFGHSWPTTSRHLRVLEQAGLLRAEKHGRGRIYRVDETRLGVVRDWLGWFTQARPTAPAAGGVDPPGTVLRNIALAYPEAREESSGEERAILVRKRPFALIQADGGGCRLSVKLPVSRSAALALPFVEPVQYRLGQSEWVVARFGPDDDPPVELLWGWIDESYRAVAPKRLSADLPPTPTVHQPPS